MEKQMTMQNIIEVYYSLKNIIDDTQYNIDPLCKFRLLGIMKTISIYVNNFDSIKNELIIKYGTQAEDGHYEIDPNDTKTIGIINEKLKPILNDELMIEIETFKPEDIFNKGIPSEYLTGIYILIEA